jgi:hypothetical protein
LPIRIEHIGGQACKVRCNTDFVRFGAKIITTNSNSEIPVVHHVPSKDIDAILTL